MYYALFILLFLFIVNRHGVNLIFDKFRNKRTNPKKVMDEHILNFIYKKTRLKLSYFWLYDSSRSSYAVIAGIPGWPQVFISLNAYKNFTRDELEWLLLHEIGHYKLWHSIREAVQQLLFIVLGVFILTTITSSYMSNLLSIVLAIVFGIIGLQLAKQNEYEAERFALSRLDNPQGMITSGKKSIEEWKE